MIEREILKSQSPWRHCANQRGQSPGELNRLTIITYLSIIDTRVDITVKEEDVSFAITTYDYENAVFYCPQTTAEKQKIGGTVKHPL